MGDVLMTVPVIDSFARQHPHVRVSVVSRIWAKPIFDLLPKNVSFIVADLKGEHSGYRGLNRLARRILALQPTHVADLHDVLRTKWLRIRFGVAGAHIAHINKNRRARRQFLTAEEKVPQTRIFDKYIQVFHQLGFRDWVMDFRSLYPEGGADLALSLPHFNLSSYQERYWVAIAPFSAHAGKTYPRPLIEEVVRMLDARGDVHLFLFGAGKEEYAILQQWSMRYQHAENLAGKLHDMGEELALISRCEVMLSMDSGNMHLASLAAIPVVSIWGATHPYAGFLGYGQSLDDALQRTDLPCRPCSIYGNKACQFGDYRCLTRISPQEVVQHLENHFL